MCMSACIIMVCLHHVHVHGGQKRASYFLELESWIVISQRVVLGATQVYCKRSKCLLLLSHLSSPGYVFFFLRCNQLSTKSILLHCNYVCVCVLSVQKFYSIAV